MIVHLILEGDLEERLARKLVPLCGHEIGTIFPQRGATNVKAKAYKYHTMTQYGQAVLVLTDYMDTREPCIPQARREYLEKHIPHPNPHFLLRFAVPELESWLLADRHGIASYLSIPLAKVPANPEILDNPKHALVRLASKSRSSTIREGIVPDAKHGGSVAPGYTGTMTRFIDTHWNIEEAQTNSGSLRRCIAALKRL